MTPIFKFAFFFYKKVKGYEFADFLGKENILKLAFNRALMFQPWMRNTVLKRKKNTRTWIVERIFKNWYLESFPF